MKVLLTVFGLALALIGVYLTFKPRGDNARGEVGGLVKVETSGGIFLILIGSMMMLLTSGVVTIGRQPDTKTDGVPATSTPSTVAPASTYASTTSITSLPPGMIKFTSPKNGSHVSGRKGVILVGIAGPLGQDTLWLMTLADNGLYYLSNDSALTIHEGRWSFHDEPIGAGASDVGATFTMLAVRADVRCKNVLENSRPNKEGDIAFDRLPDGCVKADSVSVVKTSP